MAMDQSTFGDLLYPVQMKRYGLAYNMYPIEYGEFLNVEGSTKAYEESLSLSGFGLAPVKNSGDSVSYATAKQNWKGRIIHSTFGLGYKITDEMVEDDQTKIINALPDSLARSIRVTQEIIGANILNNAVVAGHVGPDGQVLGSASHLLGGGGTWSNLGTAAALSETSLEAALIAIAGFTDDKGLPIMAKGKKLIIPKELEFTAIKLLKSMNEYDTANNAVNPMYQIMPYAVNHSLTDPAAWYITTDVPNGLIWYWRRKDKFSKDGDFDAEVAKFKTTFRCSVGWDDPRGVYVVPGS